MADMDLVRLALAAYPQTVTLNDETEVELRPASTADRDDILAFSNGLDEQDLLFLRVDITNPDVVTNWLRNVEQGETVTLLGWQDDRVVGYGTVDTNSAQWTRRVGEIRVNVAPQLRSKGLGRHLIGKAFDLARRIGLKKLMAHMTPNQQGAQAAFSRLGFRHEALLADYVEDRDGAVHDLTIMSYDVDGLSGQVDSPLRV